MIIQSDAEAAEHVPDCEVCRSKFKEPGMPMTKLPTRLYTPEEIRAATGARSSDGKRHAAQKQGLLFWYRLPPSAKVRCCFPDQQRHQIGFVVETLCGLVVNIGHVCGKKWVIGIAELVKFAGELEDYERSLRYVMAQPEDILRRSRIAADYVAEMMRFRGLVQESLPALGSEMRERARRGARGKDVQYHTMLTRDGKTIYPFVTSNLVGLELWAADMPHELVEKAENLIAWRNSELRDASTPPANIVSKIANETQKRTVRIQAVERRIGAARSFFQDGNLKLALIAAKLASTVTVENRSLVFEDKGRKAFVRLGLDGLFVVPRPGN